MKEFGVAVKAVIINSNKALVIKKSDKEEIGTNDYDIPGGRIEFGEKIKDALIREIKEELGIKIKIIKPTRTWSLTKKNFQLVGITFLCTAKSNKIRLSQEHNSYEWVSSKNTRKYPSWLKEELKIAFKEYNE